MDYYSNQTMIRKTINSTEIKCDYIIWKVENIGSSFVCGALV